MARPLSSVLQEQLLHVSETLIKHFLHSLNLLLAYLLLGDGLELVLVVDEDLSGQLAGGHQEALAHVLLAHHVGTGPQEDSRFRKKRISRLIRGNIFFYD